MRRRLVTILAGALAVIGLPAGLAASGSFLPEDHGLPPEKALLEQNAARVQAEARAEAAGRAKPSDRFAGRPRPQLNGQPPTGVVELSSPFRAEEYTLRSVGWQTVVGGERVTLYAGSLGSDPAQGVVVVTTASLPVANRPADLRNEVDPTERFAAQAFPAPARDGALEVRSAHGMRVELTSQSGARLAFDVATRKYVKG